MFLYISPSNTDIMLDFRFFVWIFLHVHSFCTCHISLKKDLVSNKPSKYLDNKDFCVLKTFPYIFANTCLLKFQNVLECLCISDVFNSIATVTGIIREYISSFLHVRYSTCYYSTSILYSTNSTVWKYVWGIPCRNSRLPYGHLSCIIFRYIPMIISMKSTHESVPFNTVWLGYM